MSETGFLAWPFFEPAHRALAADFADWVRRELVCFERAEGDKRDLARQVFQRLAAGGWLTHGLPGAGEERARVDLRRVALMRQILAQSSGLADVAFSEPWLGIIPVALFGAPEIRRALLAPFLAGTCLPAFALSEPGTGSDVAALATTARLDGNHYVIDGRKTWTSNAGSADLYIVFARVGEGRGAASLAAFAVDGTSPGILLEERIAVLGPHAVGTQRFDSCRVPADRMLGGPGDGFKIAMTALDIFRPTVGAATLGFACRALEESVARSLERRTFGKPIAEHQLIQAKLADMALKIDAAALLVYRAAWQHDCGDGRFTREAAMAKLYASEAAQEVIDEAVQISGGMGVVSGATVERLYREVRAFRIFDGSSEIQRLILAKETLKEFQARRAMA